MFHLPTNAGGRYRALNNIKSMENRKYYQIPSISGELGSIDLMS